MTELIRWEQPAMLSHRGRRRPGYPSDSRFTEHWWGENGDFAPPDYEWRSYRRDDEEIARLLLVLTFSSHTGDWSVPALLIWNFEVRRDLQRDGEHIGSAIVDALAAEFSEREIYLGPVPDSLGFWRQFGWPMCDCEECEGRDLIVRRPA